MIRTPMSKAENEEAPSPPVAAAGDGMRQLWRRGSMIFGMGLEEDPDSSKAGAAAADFESPRTIRQWLHKVVLHNFDPSKHALMAVSIAGQGGYVSSRFWFYFRRLYPIFGPTLFVIMLTLAIYSRNSDEAVMFGACLSIFSTSTVYLSYRSVIPWRKHPSPIIIWRAFSNLLFGAVVFISHVVAKVNHASSNVEGSFYSAGVCKFLSGILQFFTIATDMWIIMIAIDLIQSLTNPFASYKRNMIMYHSFTWSMAALNTFFLWGQPSCQGPFLGGVCWIDVQSDSTSCFWSFYFGWVLTFYLFAILTTAFGYLRTRKGLDVTLENRKKVVNATMKCIVAYTIHFTVISCLYFDYAAKISAKDRNKIQDTEQIAKVLAFFFCGRGDIDAIVWFLLHDFVVVDNSKAPKTHKRTKHMATDLDIDLSPQLNIALRNEILQYVTMGVQQAIMRYVPGTAQASSIDSFSFMLEGKHLFSDYCPETFYEIRQLSGIDEREYCSQLSKARKEKLSEGASGAFMFYSKDGLFMVKTVSKSEASSLHSVLEAYYNHLEANPDSLLVRFFGSHSIRMYNQTFYFVVMNNVFPPSVTLNERYDIKGSWVDRFAGTVRPGKRVYCRFCNALFVAGSSENCPDAVGPHEPNVVLKDNDLNYKLRLRAEDAFKLLDILNKDSDLLASLNLMDYSLLVGVKMMHFDVDSTAEVQEGGVLARSVIGPGVYYLGIVDFLQGWNFRKQLENWFKGYVRGKDPQGISCVHPHDYRDRFQTKMLQLIEHSNFVREITSSWKNEERFVYTSSFLVEGSEGNKMSA